MHIQKYWLLIAMVAIITSPVFVRAQSPTMSPTPPAFLQNVKTQADFDKLTPAQQKEAQDYIAQIYPGPSLGGGSAAAPAGTVNCFDYYTFGSVQVDIEPSVGSTVPGVPLTFTGVLKNANPYPIVGGQVMIKIFKKGGDDSLIHQNGYQVVDQFFAKENVTIPAKGTTPISFNWTVPAFAETGDYQAVAFFMTDKRFNLLGLPFTDDVVGNTADFSIASGEKTGVIFDKNVVTLNGKNYSFAAFPPHFTKDELVTASVKLVNTTNKAQTVGVVWTLSNWAGERPENKLDQKTETITLNPNETKSVSYETTKATGSVSFLNVVAQYQDTKSILNIRWVRDGFDETRLNFPSIMAYPLTAGTQNTVFSCFHSTNAPIVNDGELTLTLKDTNGNVIHTYDYKGGVTGAMMGVKDVFTPSKTYTDFTLTATLKNQGKVVDEVTNTYACKDIDPTLCPKENTNSSFFGTDASRLALYLILGFFALALGFFGWKFWAKRKEQAIITNDNTMKILSLIFAILLSGAFFFGGAGQAEAKSVSWSGGINPGCYVRLGVTRCHDLGYRAMAPACGVTWPIGLQDPSISVSYTATVVDTLTNASLNEGAIVSVGTNLRFSIKSYQDSDIAWNGTGRNSDTPYGKWGNDPIIFANGALCQTENYIGSNNSGSNIYIAYLANPPSTSITHLGSAQLSCDVSGFTCTVVSAGSIQSVVNFSSTESRFYYGYAPTIYGCADGSHIGTWIIDGGRPSAMRGLADGGVSANSTTDFVQIVPAQSISFNLTAVQPNQAPNAPIVTPNPASGATGTSLSFTISATDPENDQVRYGIDWDNNGTIDQWVPGTGYVASGTSQPASRTWANAGSYTFKVLAQDSNGSNSSWTSVPVTVSAIPTVHIQFQ